MLCLVLDGEDASVGSPKKILKKSCNFEAKWRNLGCFSENATFSDVTFLFFFIFFSKSLENETIPAY